MSLWTWIGCMGIFASLLHWYCLDESSSTKTKAHKNGHITRNRLPSTRPSISRSTSYGSIASVASLEFDDFQFWYIVIFNLARLSDWMLGPYVYKIYAFYHYSDYHKAILFIFGYLISGLFGIFIGSLADRFGRKRMCSLFCVLFSISSLIMTHLGSTFMAILCGRLLSGVSTPILHSVFESWMVTHHHLHQYPRCKLHETFEASQSVNSIIAIFAGIIGSYSIAMYQYFNWFPSSPPCTAPFHFSALVLVITLVLIHLKWSENFGAITRLTKLTQSIKSDKSSNTTTPQSTKSNKAFNFNVFTQSKSIKSTPSNARHSLSNSSSNHLYDDSSKSTGSGLFENITRSLNIILSDFSIFAVGVIQCGFESALYIFIFLWTKSLDEVNSPQTDGHFDHGMVFAIMMISCFIGTRIITMIRIKSERSNQLQQLSVHYRQCMQLSVLCVIDAIALLAVPMIHSFDGRLWLFVIHEICVGGYRPLMSSLRSAYVPHQYMATILSIFRVPLNVVVVAVLVNIENLGGMIFQICFLLLLTSCFCAYQLAGFK